MTQHSTIQAGATGCALARLILIAAVAAGGFHHACAQELPPTVVVTEPIQRLDFAEQVRLVGRTRAWSESRITAEVSGRLATIDAEEGVFVTKGAPLLSLDCERTRLSLGRDLCRTGSHPADPHRRTSRPKPGIPDRPR